jgi:hypothetical protein
MLANPWAACGNPVVSFPCIAVALSADFALFATFVNGSVSPSVTYLLTAITGPT